MNTVALLAHLRSKGITLTADGGNLKFTAPKGTMTDDVKALITAGKPGLLAYLTRPPEPAAPPLSATPSSGDCPLSLAQRRLWFLYQMEGPSPTYNIPAAHRIDGPLDEKALQRAFEGLVGAHESLRTLFADEAGRPVQRVIDRPPDFAFVDLTGHPDPLAEGKRLADIEAVTPFDLTAAPPLRIRLFRLSATSHILSVVLNHIVADGWSLTLFTDELRRRYESIITNRPDPLTGTPRRLQYRDYCRWQEHRYDAASVERRLSFWRQLLTGAPDRIGLPTDRPRPAIQTFRGAERLFEVDPALSARLREIAADGGASPFMLFFAAYGLLLAGLSGQNDLVIAIPAANRPAGDAESMIGLFVNTLPLRLTLEGIADFAGLLRAVRGMTLDVFAEQDIPFEMLIDALQPTRALDYNPYNQVMFLYQDRRLGGLDLPGLTAAPLGIAPRTAKCDLTLTLQDAGDRFAGTLTYATDLFDEATIDRMGSRLLGLLRQVAEDPKRPLSRIDLTDATERETLARWGTGERVSLPTTSLGELFSRQAARVPERAALVCAGRTLTYRELKSAADALSHHLIGASVGPGDVVALHMENGIGLITGMLGTLGAGAAYLPIDPTHPAERIAAMIAAAQVRVVVTEETPCDWPGVTPVVLAGIPSGAGDLPAVAPSSLAYVLFTSGSTGTPKGVAITHANVVNLVKGLKRLVYPGVQETAVVGLIANAVFDASAQQIYAALLTGRTLAVATPDEKRDGELLRRFIDTNGVALADATPSRLKLMIAAGVFAGGTSLQALLVGGEAFPAALARSISGVTLYNVYGPTECCVDVTCKRIDAARLETDVIPLGPPLPNVRLHVVDGYGKPVPIGTEGELLIAGDSVGAGYVGDPRQTAERFAAAPCVGEARVYATGDRVRWTADGELHFLGRNDGQVKVRGYRIETGEVERALTAHPAVKDAAVTAVTEADTTVLHAFVAGDVSLKELRAHLAGRLPEYMIPARFISVPAIPVNASGKVDRAGLMALPQRRLAEDFVPAGTGAEKVLAAVFAQVLHLDRVGAGDNYFALGGDSIKALQIMARLRENGWRLELRDLFAAPTVAELAPRLHPVAARRDEGPVSGEGGLFPIEEWFFAVYGRQNHFNQALLLVPLRRLDERPLQEALDAIVTRHDGLRARFDGSRRIIPPPGGRARLDVHAVSGEAAMKSAAAGIQTEFDLATGPLFRAVLFRLPDGDRLFLCAHHLVVDGVSWRIILEDIEKAYDAACRGDAVILPDRTDSLLVHADRLSAFRRRQCALSRAWWEGVEARSRQQSDPGKYSGRYSDRRRISISIDAGRTAALPRAAAEAYGANVEDLLLAALARAWGRLHAADTLVAVLESHGRDLPDADVSRTVGWFTTLHPVALPTMEDPARRIKSVKEALRAVPDDGFSYTPAPGHIPDNILFNYLGQFDELATGLFRRAEEDPGPVIAPAATVPFAHEIVGYVIAGSTTFTLDYDTARVTDADAGKLMDLFGEEAAAVIDHAAGIDQRTLTPSDIDYDGFDIDDLDRFIGGL